MFIVLLMHLTISQQEYRIFIQVDFCVVCMVLHYGLGLQS